MTEHGEVGTTGTTGTTMIPSMGGSYGSPVSTPLRGSRVGLADRSWVGGDVVVAGGQAGTASRSSSVTPHPRAGRQVQADDQRRHRPIGRPASRSHDRSPQARRHGLPVVGHRVRQDHGVGEPWAMPVRPPTSWDSPWCTPIVAFWRAPASIDQPAHRSGGEVGRIVHRGRRRRGARRPRSATASASGCVGATRPPRHAVPRAFMPVSALTRAGVDRVSSGS